MYIENPRFPKINVAYYNGSENGLLSACLPVLLLNGLSPLPKDMAILDFLRELLQTSFLVKQRHASTEASHQSGIDGPTTEVSKAQYLATSDICVLGQNTVQ